MIQINLLPDIKREYLKSQRIRNFFILGSFIACAVVAAVAVLVWAFTLNQNRHLNNLQGDIDKGLAELQAVSDLDKVVTVQNQLAAIGPLYDEKPQVAVLFDYLSLITPDKIDLGAVEFVYDESTSAEITGLGEDFKAINQFVDVLKNARYTSENQSEPTNAFTDVVLSSSGASDGGDGTSFKISMQYDPAIFDNNLEKLKLTVPKITSTQSETQRPKSLFDPNAQQEPESEEGT